MNNLYKKIFENKIWKYIYVFLISYIFFSSVLCNLIWNNSTNILHILFVDYHDEVCVSLSLILYLKELITCLKTVIESIKNKNNDYLKNVLGIVLIFLVYFGTKNKRYFVYALIIYIAKYLLFNDLCKTYLYSKVAGIIIWFGLYFTNCLEVEENYRTAMAFGTISYNDTAFTLIFTLLVWWILYGRNKKPLSNVLSISMSFFLIFLVKSRTGMVMSVLFIVMINVIDKINLNYKKVPTVIFEYFPIIMAMSAIIIGLIYRAIYLNYDVVPLIGFSSRFAEIALQLRYVGISLFPSEILETPTMYFDNTYSNLMFKRGLICTFIFMYVAIKNNYLIIKNKDKTMIFVAIFIYIYAQMEYLVKGEILILLLMYYFSMKQIKGKDNE